MEVYRAILSRRSIRRFQQRPIPVEILKKLVNAARVAPSAANLQPLEYFVVTDEKLCSDVFSTIRWAGHIKPRWMPDKNERPVAYIIILVREEIYTREQISIDYKRDVGLAAENIMLAAEGENIGSCMICSFDRAKVRKILGVPETLLVDSIIALGYKAEKSVIEDMQNGSIRYWRDRRNVMHVPKRRLDDILHINGF
ncbi:MAG: nitroreductase [Thermoplasmata archaeon]|nr:MAG: nitroreductase [Thermoplasmata archaeon]RLF33767.1 MAG: nitroreductase [Thermoplasmata archaeon]